MAILNEGDGSLKCIPQWIREVIKLIRCGYVQLQMPRLFTTRKQSLVFGANSFLFPATKSHRTQPLSSNRSCLRLRVTEIVDWSM